MNNRQLACEIAKSLFTNGAGKRAHRLVLEMSNGSNGGGWIESSVARVIEEHLDAIQQPAQQQGGQRAGECPPHIASKDGRYCISCGLMLPPTYYVPRQPSPYGEE
jgi:hypothetical protein